MALLAVWAWQHFGLGALLTLDNLKASRDALQAQVQAQPLATATVFFAVYVAAAALSIRVSSSAKIASEISPGNVHHADLSSRNHAQKAKQPAISASAAAA